MSTFTPQYGRGSSARGNAQPAFIPRGGVSPRIDQGKICDDLKLVMHRFYNDICAFCFTGNNCEYPREVLEDFARNAGYGVSDTKFQCLVVGGQESPLYRGEPGVLGKKYAKAVEKRSAGETCYIIADYDFLWFVGILRDSTLMRQGAQVEPWNPPTLPKLLKYFSNPD